MKELTKKFIENSSELDEQIERIVTEAQVVTRKWRISSELQAELLANYLRLTAGLEAEGAEFERVLKGVYETQLGNLIAEQKAESERIRTKAEAAGIELKNYN